MATANPNRASLLQTFPNRFKGRGVEVVHTGHEFTSICPVMRQPDFGKVVVKYVPGSKCLELKSFKHYLFSFRELGAAYESLVVMIFDDLIKALQPESLEVKVKFRVRGGISSVVRLSTPPKSEAMKSHGGNH